jgi:hypothetical protein
MGTIEERVAVLEEQSKTMKENIEILLTQNTQILQVLSKQRGFIGGIITAVSAVWAIVLAALAYFRHG